MAIRLSQLARSDLEDIRAYTLETWGRDQWLIYYRSMVLAFERITENPQSGKDRSLFVEGMRSINCGRHVIFYKCLEAADRKAVILRIIHQKLHMPALVYHDDLDSA